MNSNRFNIHYDQRSRYFLVLIAAILSLTTTLAFVCVCGRDCAYSAGSILIASLYILPLWLIALSFSSGIFPLRKAVYSAIPAPFFSRRSIALSTAFIFACWAIWLIALFPGSMNWDTFYQIYQCYPGNHPIMGIPWAAADSYIPNYFSDHHPIFDTLVFGAFACLSDFLFGTWNWGVFLFVTIQSVATAFSFSMAIAYTEKLGASKGTRISLLSFVCLFPIYPIYAQTMLKDSFFSWIYILFFLAIIHIVASKGLALQNSRFLVLFILCCIMLSLTKKTGVYVVIGTLLLMAIPYRKQFARLLLPLFASALVMWIVLPRIVFPLLDVAPGGKQEMLAIPFQQTACYVVNHSEELSEWEYQAIDAVLHIETLPERYDPSSSDPVKNMYDAEASFADFIEYGKAYFIEGLRHPDTYFNAWFDLTSGYLIPSSNMVVYETTGSVVEGESPLVWQPDELDGLRSLMLDAYHLASSIPGVNVIFLIAIYALWVPLICGVILAKKAPNYFPILIPFLVSFASCLITPAIHTRYALPLIYTAPILLAVTYSLCRNKDSKLPLKRRLKIAK